MYRGSRDPTNLPSKTHDTFSSRGDESIAAREFGGGRGGGAGGRAGKGVDGGEGHQRV